MERYDRNILIQQIGEQGQKKLLGSKILIAGAGGLGSTAIANMASVGIGKIGLIDSDSVEISNFNRQFIHKYKNIGLRKVDSAQQWIAKYNPDIKVSTYPIRLEENNSREIIAGYDVIIDCFDTFKSKFMLNKASIECKKPLIHAGVNEFSGQVMVIIPGKSACLECVFGEFKQAEAETKGIISSTVSNIASIQSMEAIKLILNIGNPLTNQILSYDGLSQEYKKIPVKINSKCKLCQ